MKDEFRGAAIGLDAGLPLHRELDDALHGANMHRRQANWGMSAHWTWAIQIDYVQRLMIDILC